MSTISALTNESIMSQIFGVAEAAIYSDTKSYIKNSDLQGKTKREVEEFVKGKEETQGKSDTAKRPGPWTVWTKYGADKIGTFYVSLTAFNRARDAQRQPAITPEFGVLSLPFKVQYRLMNEVARILEAACFHSAERHFPHKLVARGWDCPERAELTRFKDLLEDAFKKGYLPQNGPVPGKVNENTVASKGTKKAAPSSMTGLKKTFSLEECWPKIEEIRHISVHRNHPSAARALELLRAAENLLACLGDGPAQEKIAKLLRQTQTLRDKMQGQRSRLKSDVTKALKDLEEQRLAIARQQVDVIEGMLKQDREACDDPRTASSLDDLLRVFQVPDIPIFDDAQGGTVEQGADTTMESRHQQGEASEAIPLRDARSAQISTMQPSDVGENVPAINGEDNTQAIPGGVSSQSPLPDDEAEVPIGMRSAHSDPLRAIGEHPETIEPTGETVEGPVGPPPAPAPAPALGLDITLADHDSRNEESRSSQQTGQVKMAATDKHHPEGGSDNEKQEANARRDEDEAVIQPVDARTLRPSSADQVDTANPVALGDVTIEDT